MILQNSDFVVGIAFVIFIAILWKVNVHGFIARKLDERAARIRTELDEARRLREEAQSLLAAYERKQKEAEARVQDVVAQARAEAEAAAVQAKRDLDVAIARRLRAAQDQIAQAEADAVREVRNEAIRVAVAAAKDVIAANLTADGRARLVDDGIATVGERLH